jgi:hypothetical protein
MIKSFKRAVRVKEAAIQLQRQRDDFLPLFGSQKGEKRISGTIIFFQAECFEFVSRPAKNWMP